jgi:hypothetical protein
VKRIRRAGIIDLRADLDGLALFGGIKVDTTVRTAASLM